MSTLKLDRRVRQAEIMLNCFSVGAGPAEKLWTAVNKGAITQTTALTQSHSQKQSWGWAWVVLCFALAAHVADEAATGFLDVYNSTVLALRSRLGW